MPLSTLACAASSMPALAPVLADCSWVKGFPGGSDGKESACNAGDQGSISGLGRSPGEENGNPLQYSCLENSTDRGFSLDKTAFGEKIKRLGGEIKNIYISVSTISQQFCFLSTTSPPYFTCHRPLLPTLAVLQVALRAPGAPRV